MEIEKNYTLEDFLAELLEKKTEYRRNQKSFKEQNKHLLESIKSLENIVTDEVIKRGKTVRVEGIKAEFKPTVVIKIRKGKEND